MNRIKKYFQIFFFMFSFLFLIFLFYSSIIDKSQKDFFVLSYSFQKIILLSIQFGILLFFLIINIFNSLKKSRIIQIFTKKEKAFVIGLSLSILLFSSFLEGINILGIGINQKFWFYYENLASIIFSILILLIDIISILLINNNKENIKWDKKFLFIVLIISISFFSLFITLIKNFGFLITKERYLWNEAGNPLLFYQVVISLVCVFIFFIIKKYLLINIKNIFFILPVIIIVVAIFSWDWEVDQFSRFFLHPSAPNWEYYPDWDAKTFDIRSQKISYGFEYEGTKEIMPIILNLYHFFCRNDFGKFIIPQMILMFLLPLGVYFLAKELWNEYFGFFAGLLIVFHQKNGITFSKYMANINLHSLMSEIPTLLFIVWVCFFILKYFKTKQKIYILLGSTLLFLGTLSRLNMIIVFFFLSFFLLLIFIKIYKDNIKDYYAYFINFIILFGGWQLYIVLSTGNFTFFYKILAVIKRLINFNQRSQNNGINFLAQSLAYKDGFINNTSIFFSSINHFLNSIVTSFYVLPTKFVIFFGNMNNSFINLNFWDAKWQIETMSLGLLIVLFINFLVFISGIVFIYKRNKIIGLVPIIVYLGYLFSLGLAQTSGGRYIYPIDWVIVFYYGAGIFGLIGVFFKDSFKKYEKKEKDYFLFFSKPLYIILLLFIVFMMVFPFIGFKHFSYSQDQLTEKFKLAYIQNGKNPKDVDDWLKEDERHIIISGIALYPYQYPEDLFYNNIQTFDDEILYTSLISEDYEQLYIPVKKMNIKLPHETEIIALVLNDEKTIVYEYIYYNDNSWYLYQGDLEKTEKILQLAQ